MKLPAIGRQAGKRLCLMFKARLHLDVPGGWNANLGITINGQSLGETTAAGASRLINRTEACQTTLGDQPWWSRAAEGPRLLTFFGPAEQLDKRVLAPLEEPYLYVLDISDVANYVETGADERIESAKPNAIVLVNHFCRKPSDPETRVRDMAIEGLAVGYLPESLVVEHQKANTVQFAGDKEKARLAGDGFALVVTTTGGIRLEVGKDTYFVASSFSYPGETIGFNRLTPDDARGEKGWAPDIRKTDEGTITDRGRRRALAPRADAPAPRPAMLGRGSAREHDRCPGRHLGGQPVVDPRLSRAGELLSQRRRGSGQSRGRPCRKPDAAGDAGQQFAGHVGRRQRLPAATGDRAEGQRLLVRHAPLRPGRQGGVHHAVDVVPASAPRLLGFHQRGPARLGRELHDPGPVPVRRFRPTAETTPSSAPSARGSSTTAAPA